MRGTKHYVSAIVSLLGDEHGVTNTRYTPGVVMSLDTAQLSFDSPTSRARAKIRLFEAGYAVTEEPHGELLVKGQPR